MAYFVDGQVLFDGGQVAMSEDCCCGGIGCELCLNGNALDEYELDLAGVTALCCTAAAGWNGTYVVSWNPLTGHDVDVGCNPGMGFFCNGECGGFQFTSPFDAPKCRWIKDVPDTSCITPGPGDPGTLTLQFNVYLLQSPVDDKYYWYCRIGAGYTQATVCSVGVAHFLSAGTEENPDCLDLNVTLNYICHVWSTGPTRTADFTGATVTLRSP